MSKSITLTGIATIATIALAVAISISASAQPLPTDAPALPTAAPCKPAPVPFKGQTCWRPGLSRNIGIAEPSCDALRSDRGKIGKIARSPVT